MGRRWSPAPARASRSRRIPRRGSRGSRSWSRPRSRTPRRERRWGGSPTSRPRCVGWRRWWRRGRRRRTSSRRSSRRSASAAAAPTSRGMVRYESDDSVIGVAGWSRADDQALRGRHAVLARGRERRRPGPSERPSRARSTTTPRPRPDRAMRPQRLGHPLVGRRPDRRRRPPLGRVIAASQQRDAAARRTRRRSIAEFTELVATAIANVRGADGAGGVAGAARRGGRRRAPAGGPRPARRRPAAPGPHDHHAQAGAPGARARGADGPALVGTRRSTTRSARTVELRELAHGILPAVLTQRRAARGRRRAGVADAGAGRDRRVGRPAPAAVEATAYFVVAEALTNVAKHARAGHAEVTARIEDGTLRRRGPRRRRRRRPARRQRPHGARRTGSPRSTAALRVESPADGGTLVAADHPAAAVRCLIRGPAPGWQADGGRRGLRAVQRSWRRRARRPATARG